MDQNNEQPKIVFEGEEFQRPQSFQTQTPKIVEWVIKYSGGLIRDERQANYVLIGFVVVAIVVFLIVIFNIVRPPSPPPADQIINVAGPEGKR